jgi:radical SAM superfamily enzyme YgiQ (UPF0313 family)
VNHGGANPAKVPVYAVFPALLGAVVLRGSARLYPALSLGSVISYAKAFRGGALLRHFEFVPPFFDSSDDLKAAFAERGHGVYLFSNYLWSLSDNLAISREVKQWDLRNLTVFGGPSVPIDAGKVGEFLDAHPSVDICVRAEGEVSLAELLEQVAVHGLDGSRDLSVLGSVDGVAARTASGVVCAGERRRAFDLEAFPSPYLSGGFDHEPVDTWRYATIETNRGCPYDCTFCHWGGATAQKIALVPMERVLREIEWIGKHRIPRVYVVDANFGLLPRDVEIAKAIARAREQFGFPLELSVSYGQPAPSRLSEIVRTLAHSGVATVVNLALQTLDPATLEASGRRHVKKKWVEEVVEEFRQQDQNLCTDLLLGLPGATAESVERDLQFCFDNRISVFCYSVAVLPNTVMADEQYRRQYQIEVDADGYIVSTSTLSGRDLEQMRRLAAAFRLFVSFGVLKYVLWHLQLDHGLEATRVVRDLLRWSEGREGTGSPVHGPGTAASPATQSVIGTLLRRLQAGTSPVPEGGWRPFYEEVREFIREEYGIPMNSPLEATLAAQAAVMPTVDRKLPARVPLQHDFPAYYRDRVLGGRTSPVGSPLADYGATELLVEDPHEVCENLSHGRVKSYGNVVYWELDTVMAPKNPVPFVAKDMMVGSVK